MALAEIITETAQKGTAVFFSSHLLHDMERLCERLVVIKGGLNIYEGTTEALLEKGGVELEIVYSENGKKTSLRVKDQATLQIEIKRLTSQGSEIYEVRRLRASLE